MADHWESGARLMVEVLYTVRFTVGVRVRSCPPSVPAMDYNDFVQPVGNKQALPRVRDASAGRMTPIVI